MALNPLVSLIGRLVARSGRKRGNRQTDRQNDKTTTVTLAAHARRGLIIAALGELTVCFCTQDGFTALQLAAQEGKVDVVRLLTEAGAQLNVQTNKV